MTMRITTLVLLLGIASVAFSQDSVDVTFRYTNSAASPAYLVGEFNGWNNSAWPMTNQGSGLWTRTARLRVGGNPNPPSNGVPGGWQYKFYYAGVGTWPNDPLNHHQNSQDNNNTFLYTKDPTIYHFLPNQRQPVVNTPFPVISAYIFPKVGVQVDTASLSLTIDGTLYAVPGTAYDFSTKHLAWTPAAPLANGTHTVILSARSTAGGSNADTVSFTTQAGYVQITTHGGYETRNPFREIRGVVQNSGLTSVRIVRNGTDTVAVPLTSGAYTVVDTLVEGLNTFRALADSAGNVSVSDPVSFTYVVDHAPHALIGFTDGGSTLQLSATGSSDPDPGQAASLTYQWNEDPSNPAAIGGINGTTGATLSVAKPSKAGEYAFTLIARDADGNADTTRNYVTIRADGSVVIPAYASYPEWVKNGRIYFLFPKAASAAGTINEAAKLIPHIRDLGFNIIWVMPVMKNAYPINNGGGPGYNIVDFYTVAPEYGTNKDFKDFVNQAHTVGLKVILDVTPNHTSRFHPWSVDAHQFKQDSRYWSWYEHNKITANTNGLGDALDADGFNYYGGFSDQLLNYNWKDVDARTEMINVYKYWVKEIGLDGYRFDVYWGPHRRYGEAFMGKPVREALKHIKPDILLLGEDDGTGTGTETIYADYTGGTPGGVDAAYDFKLYFNQIRGFAFSSSAVNNLHNEADNAGYYPGPNAKYMRFMESQDEDRITWFYSANGTIDATTTFQRTMPMASVLFTIPGLPMIWNGQEVGRGYGISDFDARRRGVIDWNYQGKALLTPHYQKLAWIRGEFPAFAQHKRDTNGDGSVNASDSSDFVRVASSNGIVYAFARPYTDQNGLTVVNFSGSQQSATLDLSGGVAAFSNAAPVMVQLNDLYNGTHQQINRTAMNSVDVTLPAYGTAVFTVSTTVDSLVLPSTTGVEECGEVPGRFELGQNWPNPFNPGTNIAYTVGGIGDQGSGSRNVKLTVYNLLGQEVAVLVNEQQGPGRYTVRFDGSRLASGVYLYRLQAGSFVQTKRMLLLK